MEAKVKLLTAEVRTLQVGNRQVTLSVYRQLDHVGPGEIVPFGRVHDNKDEPDYDTCRPPFVFVVGKHAHTGALVRSSIGMPRGPIHLWVDDPEAVVTGGREGRNGLEWTFGGRDFRVHVDGYPRRSADLGWKEWQWRDANAQWQAEVDAKHLSELADRQVAITSAWQGLSLIVLAGLR